jgi:hypothetical protein
MTKPSTLISLLTIFIVFSAGCQLSQKEPDPQELSRDYIVEIIVIDGVNQIINKPFDNGWLVPVDIETNEPLTATPRLGKTYTIEFFSDSLNGRPIILEGPEGKIDINQINNHQFELMFLDTFNALTISLDFTERDGYDRRRFYNSDTVLKEIRLFPYHGVHGFLRYTYETIE